MKSKKDLVLEIIGWSGVVVLILAFVLDSFGVINQGLAYQLLNLTGAVAIVTFSLYKKSYPSAALNSSWALVALVAIVSLMVGK